MRFLLLLAGLALSSNAFALQGAYDLVLREVEGDVMATLRAHDANALELMQDIARRTHKELVGVERLEHAETISAELVDRPLNQVLFTLGGCLALRVRINPTSIELFPDLAGGASIEELEEQTTVAYLRALRAHPDHPEGARAELCLGDIQERHGNLRAAIGHYELVQRNYPDADGVPDSLWKAGTLLERLREWSDAVVKFTALANLRVQHSYAARARQELARCLVQSGDARQAILLLDALDNLFPTDDPSETKTRLFVRALALQGVGRHGDALAMLSRADALGVDPQWEAQANELRAEAFEYFDRPADAARAWLRFGQLVEGKEHERALINAARLSQAAGDPLAVLMIERTAEGLAAKIAIQPFAARAREELGLGAPDAAARVEGAIERAQSLLVVHLARQAVQALGDSWRDRESLEPAQLVALTRIYARALDEDKGLDVAIDALQRAKRNLHDPKRLAALCALAGELYEKHERYDDAARAYGGDL